MISARTIADSVNPHGSRLFTVLTRYPKFVHAEHTRHRSFSFSVSSSRAIPVVKNLEEVRSDELRAAPVWWGREQKGMESGEELTHAPRICSEREWREHALRTADAAERLLGWQVHKSIVNRILEPFLHVNVLCTGTTDGWMNFFGLRLDRAAQPEMRALAENIWREWNEHEPTRLEPGQWHLPFVDLDTVKDSCRSLTESERDRLVEGKCPSDFGDMNREGLGKPGRLVKVSVARCARLSYTGFATQRRSTIEEDLKLYDKLVAARHWSPLEHQATPDTHVSGLPAGKYDWDYWRNPHEGGNLGPGWRQLRAMMPSEKIAPLPEEYKRT